MEPRPDYRLDPFAPGAEKYDGAAADDLDFDRLDYNDPAILAKLTGLRPPPTMSPE